MIVKTVLLGFVMAGAYGAAEAARHTSSYIVISLASTEAGTAHTVTAR